MKTALLLLCVLLPGSVLAVDQWVDVSASESVKLPKVTTAGGVSTVFGGCSALTPNYAVDSTGVGVVWGGLVTGSVTYIFAMVCDERMICAYYIPTAGQDKWILTTVEDDGLGDIIPHYLQRACRLSVGDTLAAPLGSVIADTLLRIDHAKACAAFIVANSIETAPIARNAQGVRFYKWVSDSVAGRNGFDVGTMGTVFPISRRGYLHFTNFLDWNDDNILNASKLMAGQHVVPYVGFTYNPADTTPHGLTGGTALQYDGTTSTVAAFGSSSGYPVESPGLPFQRCMQFDEDLYRCEVVGTIPPGWTFRRFGLFEGTSTNTSGTVGPVNFNLYGYTGVTTGISFTFSFRYTNLTYCTPWYQNVPRPLKWHYGVDTASSVQTFTPEMSAGTATIFDWGLRTGSCDLRNKGAAPGFELIANPRIGVHVGVLQMFQQPSGSLPAGRNVCPLWVHVFPAGVNSMAAGNGTYKKLVFTDPFSIGQPVVAAAPFNVANGTNLSFSIVCPGASYFDVYPRPASGTFSVNHSSGVVTWTSTEAGEHDLTLWAHGEGQSTFSFCRINSGTGTPTTLQLVSSSVVTIAPGQTSSAIIGNIDAYSVTWSATGLPAGVTIQNANEPGGIPTASFQIATTINPGTYTIQLTGNGPDGLTLTKPVKLILQSPTGTPDQAPTFGTTTTTIAPNTAPGIFGGAPIVQEPHTNVSTSTTTQYGGATVPGGITQTTTTTTTTNADGSIDITTATETATADQQGDVTYMFDTSTVSKPPGSKFGEVKLDPTAVREGVNKFAFTGWESIIPQTQRNHHIELALVGEGAVIAPITISIDTIPAESSPMHQGRLFIRALLLCFCIYRFFAAIWLAMRQY